MASLDAYLILASLLFGIGLIAALSRRNAILILMGVELMLNAANVSFIGFWKSGAGGSASEGPIVILFVLAVAAAEAAVGLGLVLAWYRHSGSVEVNQADRLKG